jgi:hypothetical protein
MRGDDFAADPNCAECSRDDDASVSVPASHVSYRGRRSPARIRSSSRRTAPSRP